MTILDFQYQKEFEITRAKNCVSNLPWYKENGYKVSLPENISEESSEDAIFDAVQMEYREERYSNFLNEIETEWSNFYTTFEKTKAKVEIDFRDCYKIILTRYGTGGSYNATSNQIILKFEGRTSSSVLATLIHEMVHIAIQKYIEKYEVSHWKKERLVDLILEHYFPGLRMIQNISEDVRDVDGAFQDNFPDLEKITMIVGSKKF